MSLAPDQIEAPAFIVDKDLSLLWVAPNGQDPLTQALSLELESASTRNIFDLLLRPSIKESLSDWQAFFSFVYVTLRRSTSRDTFDTQTVFISKDHIPTTDAPSFLGPGTYPFKVDCCLIGWGEGSATSPKRIFGLEFKAGTLFLIRQDLWHTAAAANSVKELAVGRSEQPNDEKKTTGVLSARLNDSHRIADSMLSEVYFRLMNIIWDEADGIVRSLGGIRAGSNGAQIHYMFTESVGRHPIFSAICCATQINTRLRAVEEKLRAQQGWADEIFMNMGISHGQHDQTASDPNGSLEFMIPGGAFDHASQLSAIAAKGEIWITKNAVAQLPKKLIDQVVLGVDRQGRFLRNFFMRFSDLPQGAWARQTNLDPGPLTIARVVKIEK